MINKLLDSMIKATKTDGCGVYNTLNVYDGIEELGCDGNCESCKRESVTRIERLKKQAISDKTSDTSSDTLSETRKELDKCRENKMIKRIEFIFRILGWALFGSGVALLQKEQYEIACWMLLVTSLCLGFAGFIALAINLCD